MRMLPEQLCHFFIAKSLSFLGLLAGPTGIRAGWAIEIKSRLGAE